MLDLNDLRLFERVAGLRSFAAASRALGVPTSSVSRGVQRLEAALGTRLLQRTTRRVVPTASGALLLARCTELLGQLDAALDDVAGLEHGPRGRLRISAGIGFGINVLSELLPEFVRRHPQVDVALDLTSQPVDLVAAGIDVAIRLGPMPDSQLVQMRLGVMQRYLCASPDYVARRGLPEAPDELQRHDVVEMPGLDGRPRPWLLQRDGRTMRLALEPRLQVNEAVTIHRLVLNGAGIGCISGYLCAPAVASGTLVRVLPGWTLPALDVHLVFPSRRELSSTVRAFVSFMRQASRPGILWQDDPLAAEPG